MYFELYKTKYNIILNQRIPLDSTLFPSDFFEQTVRPGPTQEAYAMMCGIAFSSMTPE